MPTTDRPTGFCEECGRHRELIGLLCEQCDRDERIEAGEGTGIGDSLMAAGV